MVLNIDLRTFIHVFVCACSIYHLHLPYIHIWYTIDCFMLKPSPPPTHTHTHTQMIHEGPISGLKLGKEDIEMARKETECGVSFSTDPGYMEGDRVVCFNKEKRPTTLNWNLGF